VHFDLFNVNVNANNVIFFDDVRMYCLCWSITIYYIGIDVWSLIVIIYVRVFPSSGTLGAGTIDTHPLLETYCIFSPYRLTTLIIVILCHCIFRKMNYAICWLWISATDLATHFTVFKEQQKLLVEFQKHKADQRRLLLSLCMTACDLSDQTKDWSVVRETAVSINKNKQMNPWLCY